VEHRDRVDLQGQGERDQYWGQHRRSKEAQVGLYWHGEWCHDPGRSGQKADQPWEGSRGQLGQRTEAHHPEESRSGEKQTILIGTVPCNVESGNQRFVFHGKREPSSSMERACGHN
jgi:hypothetical protein